MTNLKQPTKTNRLEIFRSEVTKAKISRTMKENYRHNAFPEERKRKISESMKEQWKRKREEYENNMKNLEDTNEPK